MKYKLVEFLNDEYGAAYKVFINDIETKYKVFTGDFDSDFLLTVKSDKNKIGSITLTKDQYRTMKLSATSISKEMILPHLRNKKLSKI